LAAVIEKLLTYCFLFNKHHSNKWGKFFVYIKKTEHRRPEP
jgi:hypothetical protein